MLSILKILTTKTSLQLFIIEISTNTNMINICYHHIKIPTVKRLKKTLYKVHHCNPLAGK